jgi:N-acetylmuramoyl-L-alanine amidase
MFHFVKRRPLIELIALSLLSLALTSRGEDNLGVLGTRPTWKVLEKYHRTISHDDFVRLIETVYCTHGLPPDMLTVDDESARILRNRKSQSFFTLRFAAEDTTRPVPRLWRPASALPSAPPGKPLSGIKVALDPGHLGGKWAKIEERWFQVGDKPPVQEGDLVLQVSRMLAPRLKQLGAKVFFVRKDAEPVTLQRPDDFKELARKILVKNGVPQPRPDALDPADPEKEQTIRWQSEILFYR